MLSRLSNIAPLNWWFESGLALLLLISLLLIFLLYYRMKRFEDSHLALRTFLSGNQLDTLLQEYTRKVEEQDLELKKTSARLTPIEDKLRDSIDRASIIRFKAFEDVGSDLSFALALLNQEGDGVVISAIHSRDESRVYGKPLKHGNSTYMLTEEENEAVYKAMEGRKI
ncbi:MAG: DUF4446 family protein [Bacillota bacterium]|nr:DUF4446 family protein [Bacillota bacterium]